jgi:ATP-dependent Clp protease, protease subunit
VAEEILKTRKRIQELYQKHTGQPEHVIDRVLERDTHMSALEAKEFGLVDEVIVKAKDVMDVKEGSSLKQ